MRKLGVSFIVLSCLCSSIAFSRSYIFTGTGNWNAPSHWKDGLIPKNYSLNDFVIIAGNATITGNVTYTCGMSVSSGSSLTIATGAIFTLQHDGSPYSTCPGDGGLWFGGATITVQSGATFNCNDWIYDCGTLNVNGTMKCNFVSQDFTNEPATINGYLEIGGGLFAAFASPIIINNGGILRVKSGTLLASTNAITVNPGGTLDNLGTIKGNTTIITSLFINPATLSPGNSPGTITINGDYMPTSTSNHIMEIGGTSAGSYDQINVSGNVNLDGALNASLYGGFTPSTSHDIPIVTGSSITGTFSSANIPAGYLVIYNPTSVVLRFSSTLPVNFVSLNAVKEGNSNTIKWKVAEEQDVSGYEVEKSTDGKSFENIGWVAATGSTSYSFQDHNGGRAFYRIKSVDLNRTYKYSPILKVSGDYGTVLLNAFPSPATNELTVQHPTSSKSKLLVNSVDGRNVMSVLPNAASQQTKINISNLKAGVYVIIYQDNEQMQSLKIIKR